MGRRGVVDYMYLATSTRIGRADISNGFNTVLTFFQTSDISKIFIVKDARNIELDALK
jgi:hypothetical protein